MCFKIRVESLGLKTKQNKFWPIYPHATINKRVLKALKFCLWGLGGFIVTFPSV